MTKINDGGATFPVGLNKDEGMTLRDWFAGQALPGIIAQPNLDGWEPHIIAGWAYEIADAMIAARGDA